LLLVRVLASLIDFCS